MRCRCPHCHNPIEIVADDPLIDIECPSCGSHFELVGAQSTASYQSTPKKIAQFELLDQVGMGKFGSVWKARDTELDRIVAIKIPRVGPLEEAESSQFLREARAAAQVKHSNIVSVHEVGREDGTIYIVSDFIDGANLKEYVSGQLLSFRETAKLCATIAEALHAAHEAGVIHRDLKPQNIMIDREGTPYVADFGLAKREAGEITITVDGQILGTPAYMPPEQIEKAHEVDRRADVYSLGVILFELITGELPFRGQRQMVLLQIQRDEPTQPRKLNGRIPRDLETICLKCMEKDRARRYPTAGALAADCKRYISGQPISAWPVSRTERAWRWCRRKPVIAGLAAALFLAVLSGVGGILSQWRRAENKTAELQIEQTETKRQFKRAEENSKRAEANFEIAMIALDFVSREVGDGELAGVPQAETVRQNVLEHALKLHETFLERRGSDPSARWEAAKSYLRVGAVRKMLGRGPQAMEAYRKAISICEELAATEPEAADYRKILIHSWVGVGNLHVTAERFEEADVAYQKMDEHIQLLPRESQANTEFRQVQSACRQLQAYRLNTAQRFAEAEPLAREAISILRELQSQYPDDTGILMSLASVYSTLAISLKNTRQIASAEDAYKMAIGVFETAAKGEPSESLATNYRNLALLYRQLRRFEEATLYYTRAEKTFAQLSDDFPRTPKYHHELAETLHGLTLALQEDSNNFALCRDHLKRAVEHERQAVQTSPDNPSFRRTLRRCLLNLAGMHAELGEHRETVSSAVELSEVAENGMDFMMAATMLTISVQLADIDSRLDRKGKAAAIESYVNHAASVLRKAIEGGYLKTEHIRGNATLRPLLRYAQIRELIAPNGAGQPKD